MSLRHVVTNADASNPIGLNVLFLAAEFTTWRQGRMWSYGAQLGLADALNNEGANCYTIPSPWWHRAQELCQGKRFDQVWVHPLYKDVDNEFCQWVAGVAPVRIGFVSESLDYDAAELAQHPEFAEHRLKFQKWKPYLTHALMGDEHDVACVNQAGAIQALWWASSVPTSFILKQPGIATRRHAVFPGTPYGERQLWLQHRDLRTLLKHQPAPETKTLLPGMFDFLRHNCQRYARRRYLPSPRLAAHSYVTLLRAIRRKCLALYLNGLGKTSAIVNLPHWFKGYAGRVIEGMASGRPVISWEVPDRPLNKALFTPEKEILLFDKSIRNNSQSI